jgi:hypothetical protein
MWLPTLPRPGLFLFGDEGKTWELRVSPDMEGEWQVGWIKKFFKTMDWWKLESHDELLTCNIPHDHDEREYDQVVPPSKAYWLLSHPV